jgi:uncharacterized glyoxalase superfamily protein PhnB
MEDRTPSVRQPNSEAGGTIVMDAADQFWGDRSGTKEAMASMAS